MPELKSKKLETVPNKTGQPVYTLKELYKLLDEQKVGKIDQAKVGILLMKAQSSLKRKEDYESFVMALEQFVEPYHNFNMKEFGDGDRRKFDAKPRKFNIGELERFAESLFYLSSNSKNTIEFRKASYALGYAFTVRTDLDPNLLTTKVLDNIMELAKFVEKKGDDHSFFPVLLANKSLYLSKIDVKELEEMIVTGNRFMHVFLKREKTSDYTFYVLPIDYETPLNIEYFRLLDTFNSSKYDVLELKRFLPIINGAENLTKKDLIKLLKTIKETHEKIDDISKNLERNNPEDYGIVYNASYDVTRTLYELLFFQSKKVNLSFEEIIKLFKNAVEIYEKIDLEEFRSAYSSGSHLLLSLAYSKKLNLDNFNIEGVRRLLIMGKIVKVAGKANERLTEITKPVVTEIEKNLYSYIVKKEYSLVDAEFQKQYARYLKLRDAIKNITPSDYFPTSPELTFNLALKFISSGIADEEIISFLKYLGGKDGQYTYDEIKLISHISSSKPELFKQSFLDSFKFAKENKLDPEAFSFVFALSFNMSKEGLDPDKALKYFLPDLKKIKYEKKDFSFWGLASEFDIFSGVTYETLAKYLEIAKKHEKLLDNYYYNYGKIEQIRNFKHLINACETFEELNLEFSLELYGLFSDFYRKGYNAQDVLKIVASEFPGILELYRTSYENLSAFVPLLYKNYLESKKHPEKPVLIFTTPPEIGAIEKLTKEYTFAWWGFSPVELSRRYGNLPPSKIFLSSGHTDVGDAKGYWKSEAYTSFVKKAHIKMAKMNDESMWAYLPASVMKPALPLFAWYGSSVHTPDKQPSLDQLFASAGEFALFKMFLTKPTPEQILNIAYALDVIGPEMTLKLYQECGITHFGRFAPKVLNNLFLDLDTERKKDLSPVFVSYAATDWNGAFYYTMTSESWENAFKKYRIVVIETPVPDRELIPYFKKFSGRYGKAKDVLLAGHGFEEGVIFGTLKQVIAYERVRRQPSKIISDDAITELGIISNKDKELFQQLKPYINEDAKIYFASCSTGKTESGIAATTSKESGKVTVAPDDTTGVIIRASDDGQFSFSYFPWVNKKTFSGGLSQEPGSF
jgi:hypothetical protein